MSAGASCAVAALLYIHNSAAACQSEGAPAPVSVSVTLPKIDFRNITIYDREIFSVAADGVAPAIEPGRPPVPMRRVLVDVPRDANVNLTVEAVGERTIAMPAAGVAPRRVPAESVQITGGRSEGIVSNSEFVMIDEPAAAGEFPESWAKIEYVGDYGSRHVASVLYACARVDARHRIARAATTLNFTIISTPWPSAPSPSVTLKYAHTPPATHTPPPHPAPFVTTSTPAVFPQPTWKLKIEVDQRGIYSIKPSDLAAAGVPASLVLPKRLVLYHDGRVVPISVEGEADAIFDINDRILFYGEPLASQYTKRNAYFLAQLPQDATAVFGSTARWEQADGTVVSTNPQAPYFRETGHYEQNGLYWQLLPNGDGKDHWFWKKTLAPATNTYPAALYDLVLPGSGNAKIRVSMHGYTDPVQNPDHHTRIKLNNTTISDATWNGITPLVQEASFASSLLIGGVNNVNLDQVADTGAIVDGIYTNWVECDYDRYFYSIGDELYFTYAADASTNFSVRKFQSSNVYCLDVTNPDKVRRFVNGTLSGTASYIMTISVAGNGAPGSIGKYYFATPAVFKTPVSIKNPAAAFVPPAVGADWIVIAPQNYHSALAPLIQRRMSQNLRVCLVTPDEIYDNFGAGIFGPEAIRDFLKIAYQTWPAPAPKYVLLAGDASIDPLNNFGVGIQTQIPAPLHSVISDGEIPSDHYYACLVGNDPLPEVNVGRIPAATASELTLVINKILAHETGAPAGNWKTTVSHFADKGVDFTNTMNALASGHVPPSFSVHNIYADNYASTGAAHTAMVSELNLGSSLATYLGHGSSVNWSNYLSMTDAGSLTNGPRTQFITALNCSNGYYASPSQQHGMAESLLFSAGGGAVGCFASAGLGFLSQLTPIANFAYDRVFALQTMGEVTTGAKVDAYLQAGVTEENLWQSLLLGDPAGGVLP